uniref:Uncharacterized protein n=1 Tax=Rhizobium johnstonii (strain DSM 114642 / LMG 32736 / 3841) TaxID=216596 RepID=Q7WYS6_RHIJ3|nr:hypothetical protein [Rhizobium johnstonii 3841]
MAEVSDPAEFPEIGSEDCCAEHGVYGRGSLLRLEDVDFRYIGARIVQMPDRVRVDAVLIAIRRGVVEVVHRDRANREPGTCLFVHNTVDDQSKHGDPWGARRVG